MDASEIHAWRLKAKEVLTPQSGEQNLFPIADGQSNYLEEIRFCEHPLWSGTIQTEEKNKKIFQENQTGFHQPIPKVQCSHCLLDWYQGIVYCTCGQCLIDCKSRRKFNKLRLDGTLHPELRDKERTYSWGSTWQN